MSLFKKHLLKLNLNLTCFVHTFGHHQRFSLKDTFIKILFLFGKESVTLQSISSLSEIIITPAFFKASY
jgi:hypothetical protein